MKADKTDSEQSPQALIWLCVLIGALCVVYFTTWQHLIGVWWRDPQYSHGFLVPGFALAVLWLRRSRMPLAPFQPSWSGLILVAMALAGRLSGKVFYFEWLEHFSLLLALFGIVLTVGGLDLLAWSWGAIAFLAFMIPFPYRMEILLSDPLQKLATWASCYMLQTFGQLAVAEGNVIRLANTDIEVVQACNGLRMSVSFLAISVATAMVSPRRLWERVMLVASAIPIALVCNVVRITATGCVANLWSQRVGHVVFHDLAGWLMMPLAIALLALELWLVSFLLMEPSTHGPLPLMGPPGHKVKPAGGTSTPAPTS